MQAAYVQKNGCEITDHCAWAESGDCLERGRKKKQALGEQQTGRAQVCVCV